jgi:cytochrome c
MMKKKTLPLTIVAASLLFAVNAQAAGDAEKGAKIFARCTACHTIKVGDPNRIGPNFHGLFDRQAGKAAGFAYSDGLAGADFKWDDEKLAKWLENPQAFIQGARMPFKLPNSQDREDVIAYLHQATQ